MKVSCSVCEAGSPAQRNPSRDYVPSASLTWPWAQRTKTRRLRFIGQATSASRICNVGDLVAAISASPGGHVHLQAAPLRPQVRPPPEGSFLVWRAATAGCTVHAGTVELPERGVLLLAGAGVHFHGTTFKGGVVMSAGAQHSGSFQNCIFRGTAVYVVHGGAVSLRGCRIYDTQPGITASGEGTYATVSRTSVHNCRTSVAVDRGATVKALGCHLTRTGLSAAAVAVTGPGGHAVLEECFVSGDRLLPGLSIDGETGVAVRRGAARLTRSILDHFTTAACGIGAESSIELHRVQVVSCFEGVVVGGHARALVRDSQLCCGSLADTAFATGLAVRATHGRPGGACMQAERCEVSGWAVGPRGISAGGRGAVAAALCRFTCSAEVMRTAAGGGRVSLSHCRGDSPGFCLTADNAGDMLRLKGGFYEGSATACLVSGGAKLAAVGCEFRSRSEALVRGVVTVIGGSHARLLRCHVQDGVMGAMCSDATLHVTDTTVADIRVVVPDRRDPTGKLMQGGAGYVALGGRLIVKGGSVRRCVVGVEAQRGDDGSFGAAHVALKRVACIDCVVGVLATHNAEVHVTRCEFQGPQCKRREGAPVDWRNRRFPAKASMAIAFHDSALGSVSHCSCEGFRLGAQPASSHELSMRHCSFTNDQRKAGCVLVSGSVSLEDCSVRAAAGLETSGVTAVAGSHCELRRCRFTGVSTGVTATGRCTVTALGVNIDGRDAGFSVYDEACMALQDCHVSGARIAAAFEGAGGGSLSAKRVTLQAAELQLRVSVTKHDGKRAPMTVKLVDSVLTGGHGGVSVQASAEVSLLRCTVSDTGLGCSLRGPCDVRIKDTSFSRCNTAVLAGSGEEEMVQKCLVCGISGEVAFAKALDAVAVSGPGGVRGAPCVHAGAVARLRMAGCTMAHCETATFVAADGYVVAERVTAQACDIGFSVLRIHVRNRFSGCRAVGCRVASEEFDGRAAPQGPIPEIAVVPVSEE